MVRSQSIIAGLSAASLCTILIGCSKTDNSSTAEPASTADLATSVSVTLGNSLDLTRSDESIIITRAALAAVAPALDIASLTVYEQDKLVASQLHDSDGDGNADQLLFVTDLAAKQQKQLSLRVGRDAKQQFTKRTQAELSKRVGGQLVDGKYQGGKFEQIHYEQLPASHVPGDGLYRYEGPGWESDKVAYRLYFDERNAMDIFGKKIPDMVLQDVGHGDYSYHKPADWGLDILKVGDSLGMGSIGMVVDDKVHRVATADTMSVRIVENGPLRSQLRVKHTNWTLGDGSYSLTSDLSIHAGSHMTHNQLAITGEPPNLTTGIVKHQPTQVLRSNDASSQWAYLATFGKQSYVEDELGMAIVYKNANLIKVSEDENSQLVIMKPAQGKLDYYFLARWVQEPNGIKTQEAFKQYLDNTVAKLNTPVKITLTATNP